MPQETTSWKTMSGSCTVGQIVKLLENRDEDAIASITSMLFVSQSHIERQAKMRAEALAKDEPYLFTLL